MLFRAIRLKLVLAVGAALVATGLGAARPAIPSTSAAAATAIVRQQAVSAAPVVQMAVAPPTVASWQPALDGRGDRDRDRDRGRCDRDDRGCGRSRCDWCGGGYNPCGYWSYNCGGYAPWCGYYGCGGYAPPIVPQQICYATYYDLYGIPQVYAYYC